MAAAQLLHGRYRLERVIGQGGMGLVFAATDQRDGSTVAIKRSLADGPFRASFAREVRILSRLRHRALPRVREHFSNADGLFLVMEYVPGDDLAALLRQTGIPFALADVLRWADELLDVLTYLHRRRPPVLHRDIKPQNLKLSAQGTLMLLDFGLAKGLSGQTTHSTFGFTLAYAPLEQIQGKGTSPQSDLYALAATLYDLLTASKPPDALERAAAILAGRPDPLRPAHTLNPLVPAGVAAALHHALALDPARRPASAAVLRAALYDASDEPTQSGGLLPSIPPTDTPTSAQTTLAHHLPASASSFVGRAAEIATAVALLTRPATRLLTLTGPGGVGKTRLAIQVAEALVQQEPTPALARDGIWFVALAAISDPALVGVALAQALGVKERGDQPLLATLKAYLRTRQLIVLLDNFEQVIAAATLVAELLAAAPGLRLLITSRELLNIYGEHELVVAPLPVPAIGGGDAAPVLLQIASAPAVALFVQRAQAVNTAKAR